MNRTRIANIVAGIAILVLLSHAARAFLSQKRWVTAVVEVAAAIVMAWQLYLLSRYKEPLDVYTRPR